ncbi:MAG: YdcF family protein [Bdellovibrionales bacterium]|nr:YdcF family protein [Bdellovibrionales bacterium]
MKSKIATALKNFAKRIRLAERLVPLLWVLVGVLLGGVSFSLISGGEIYEYQDSFDGVNLPDVDVIVCLGGGRGRISVAGDIWYRYWEQLKGEKLPVLYFSGMGKTTVFATLSKQLRRGVRDAIRSDQVVIETESTNTEENAEVFERFARERKWKRLLLVTSRYHMRRARFIFERILWERELGMQIDTASVYQEPFEPEEWRRSIHGIEVTLSEYFKWLGYRTFWTP